MNVPIGRAGNCATKASAICGRGALRKGFIAAATCLLLVLGLAAAKAEQISGTIDFVGGADINGALGSASTFTSYFGADSPIPTVLGGSQTGDYHDVSGGTGVTINELVFEPYNPSATLSIPLWTFYAGQTHYGFTVTSIQTVVEIPSTTPPSGAVTPNYLNVEGSGIASISGYEDTPATWSITGTWFNGQSSLNFGSSFAALPEAAATAWTSALLLLLYVLTATLGGKMRSGERAGAVSPVPRA